MKTVTRATEEICAFDAQEFIELLEAVVAKVPGNAQIVSIDRTFDFEDGTGRTIATTYSVTLEWNEEVI